MIRFEKCYIFYLLGSYVLFFSSVSSVVLVTSPDSAENSLDLFDTTCTQDVWDIAAMFIPVKGLLWPAVETGFTIASWVKLSEDEENVVKISKSSSGNHVYFSSSEGILLNAASISANFNIQSNLPM